MWEAFQSCGWPAYGTVFIALLSVAVSVVTIVMVVQMRDWNLAMGWLAFVLSFLPTVAGFMGTAHKEQQAREAIGNVAPAERERLHKAIFAEASKCHKASGPPFLVSFLLGVTALAMALDANGFQVRGSSRRRRD